MAAKKFSVTYFLNTRLKAKNGNKYSVYVRIIYNKITNTIISHSLKDTYFSQEEFEIINSNAEASDQNLSEWQKQLHTEKNIFLWIFNFLGKSGKDISVYDFPHYFEIFNTDVEDVLNQKKSELFRSELCEFLQKKTGLRYRSIERMLVNENTLDMEDLMDKDSGYQNFSKELLKYMIAQAEMENVKTTNPQAETKILDWFYKGLKELYANVPPLKKLNPKYEKFHLDNELVDFAIYPDKVAAFIDAAIQGFIKRKITDL